MQVPCLACGVPWKNKKMEILLLKQVMMMTMMVPTNDDDDDGDVTMMTTMTSESCRHRYVGSLNIMISNDLFLVITYTSSVYDDDDDDQSSSMHTVQ
jgi:hypothetical protein